MNEARAKEICKATYFALRKISHDDCAKADLWVKNYALRHLKSVLKTMVMPKMVRDYIMLMARCHYGSVETDTFLKDLHCYPEWL